MTRRSNPVEHPDIEWPFFSGPFYHEGFHQFAGAEGVVDEFNDPRRKTVACHRLISLDQIRDDDVLTKRRRHKRGVGLCEDCSLPLYLVDGGGLDEDYLPWNVHTGDDSDSEAGAHVHV